MKHAPQLGELITNGDRCRDAIHIAIAPVTAAVKLSPGEDVGLCEGSRDRVEESGKPVGIVDPFLTSAVEPGQRFWLFVYPNTITGLRHVWTHPAFQSRPARESNRV